MAFIVSSSSSSSSGLSSPSGATPGISGSSFANAAGSYLINRYAPTLLNAASDRVDRTVNNIADVISGNSRTGTPGKSGNNSGNSGNGNDSNGNKAGPANGNRGGRRPAKGKIPGVGGSPNTPGVPQFTINSGIDSGTIVNPLQRTTEFYSPLYIQCGSLFPDKEEQKDSDFSQVLNSSLFYKYLIIVQSEVNFTLARQFTEVNFYSYINKVSHALQLYYMIDSILAFTSHTPNFNLAMTSLRSSITPDISNSHIKLREILESTPIPPKLLEYIRYMYQNYSFNNVSGSSVIRLSLGDSLCTSEYSDRLGITTETYSKVINQLIDCSEVSSIIRKIRSNWVVSMPPSSYEALFDPQFSTFWHNSNIMYEDYGSKTVMSTINVKSNFEPIYYGIFDNRLDGIIYATCSVVDNNQVTQKGIWKPFSDFKDKKSINSSLLHYSNDNVVRPVTEVSFRNASMVFAAPHTEITKDSNPVWKVNRSNFAGSCIPQVHTLENVTQAVTRSVYWLLAPS